MKSATASNLVGTWSIYEVGFEGERTAVPPANQDCGREFFTFNAENTYTEFLFLDSACTTDTNKYSTELANGIITLTNQSGQKEELVIVELTSQILNFKAQFDIDDDGSLDILTFYAQKYNPPTEIDIYSSSFAHDKVLPHYDKIRLTWQPYAGYNEFSRYEIYRSAGDCDKADAELIATLDTQELEFFIDEDPAIDNILCYYFRVYTNKGLLGESNLVTVETDYLKVPPVTVSEPLVGNESIELNWTKYSGRYFSHYEITARNYLSGSGSGFQELIVTTIDNIDTLEYTDNNPPYFLNPVYTVYVVDIFGNRSHGFIDGGYSWRVNFKRPEVIELDFIRKLAIDPEEPIIYFYGRETISQDLNIVRYNYNTNIIEAISDMPPTGHTDLDMKVIVSEEGKEILFAQGHDFNIYDATTLQYKYDMRISDVYPSFEDFDYQSNLWVFTNGEEVFTCNRNGSDLTIIDREVHFTEHQSYNNYQIIKLDNDQILIGHSNEPSSLRFKIDAGGFLTERTSVPITIKSDWKKETFYNTAQNYIINLVEGRLYSGTDYSPIDTFSEPNFPYGISADGNLVLGSNNDPKTIDLLNSTHEKRAYLYNRSLQSIEVYDTKGYPHFIFENHLGQIFSVSSGLQRPHLDRSMPAPDLFIERVY
jgi:hypothetical protein